MKKNLSLFSAIYASIFFGSIFTVNATESQAVEITMNSANITWHTETPSYSSYLRFGTSPKNYTSYTTERCDQSATQLLETDHCLKLSNLHPNTTYYYVEPSNTVNATGVFVEKTFKTLPEITTTTEPVTVTSPLSQTTQVATIPSKPETPSSLVGTINSNGIVTLTWMDLSSDETRFEIYKSLSTENISLSSVVSTTDPNITSYVETSPLSLGTYVYAVAACNNYGCSQRTYSSNITKAESPTQEASPATSPVVTVTWDTAPAPTKVAVTENNQSMPIPTLSAYEISRVFGKVTSGSYVTAVKGSEKFFARADQEGYFPLVVKDGVYTVQAIPREANTTINTKIITIALGKIAKVENQIITSVKKVTGKVLLPSGTPVIDAQVSAYNSYTGQYISANTDSLGMYVLELNSGTWSIVAKPKNSAANTNTWDSSAPEAVTFTSSPESETKDLTINVTQITTAVTIMVKDETGNLLPNIGVIIDSKSISNSSLQNNSGRKVKTRKTSLEGTVTSKISTGIYYIRVAAPESLHYTQAPEQQVSLLPGESKSVEFILIKEKAVENIAVSGTVSFNDNIKTSAFITAWSDKGEHINTETTAAGNFTLTLVKGQTWHIKATKDDTRSKSYISDKQTIFIENEQTIIKPLEFIFQKNDAISLPPSVTLKSTVAESSVVSSLDGARFNLPAYGVTGYGSLNVEMRATVEAPSLSANTVVSAAYDITVKNSAGQEISQLEKEAEILIPYSDSDLAAAGVKLEDVIPSYFDETLNTWISVQNFTINKDKKVFVLRVDHLTRFALIAAADTVPPSSPTNIVTDAITPTDVRITWNNPSADFSHAKIYRSESQGTFGQVIATEVLSNSFIDKTSASAKKIYYYTIRAVDAAGNESTNSNQLAVTTTGSSLTVTQKKSSLLLPPGQDSGTQIVRTLSVGSKGDDVTMLQKTLKYDGFYATGPITGYYGKLTENAVFRFQNYYKDELLIPNGYKIGTGVVGEITRKKINQILLESGQ